MSTFTTKYLPLILTVLAALGSAFSTTMQGYWSAHPEASGIVASLIATLALFFPQPHK